MSYQDISPRLTDLLLEPYSLIDLYTYICMYINEPQVRVVIYGIALDGESILIMPEFAYLRACSIKAHTSLTSHLGNSL